jgi:hypothetical protein
VHPPQTLNIHESKRKDTIPMTGNIFARARAYASLTPAERALLKLIEGLICAALVAALPIVADALSHGGVDWPAILRAALAAASVAILMALTKYARAQADPVLATAAGAGDAADAGGVPVPDVPMRTAQASVSNAGAGRQPQP